MRDGLEPRWLPLEGSLPVIWPKQKNVVFIYMVLANPRQVSDQLKRHFYLAFLHALLIL